MPEVKKLNVDNFEKQISLEDRKWREWVSMNTLKFGSIIDIGIDWGRNSWSAWNISDEAMAVLRPRLNKKIEDRYYFREIGRTPPPAFFKSLESRITEAVTKRGFLYEAAFQGLDFSLAEIEFLKKRDLQSEYAQGLVMPGEEDYLSSGTEGGVLRKLSHATLKGLMEFSAATEEPDAGVLRDIDICFSQIFSRNPG